MRLLMITQDFPPDVGGTQTYAAALARHLAPCCEDFAVIAPARPTAAAVDATLPYEVVRVRASDDTLSLRALVPLLSLARRRGFEAVFHVQWPTAIASLLARPFGGPGAIFVAAHGRELLLTPLVRYATLNRLYNRLRVWVLQHVDGLFPVSRYTRTLLQECGVAAERMTVVPNATEPGRFHPMDAQWLRQKLGLDHHKVVLTVGRLVPHKGIDTVLRALPHVICRLPNVCYVIGGSGPDRERLEALTRDLHLTDRVRFLGTIPPDDLPHYYNACDVFVMPSREAIPCVEGFGIVFLEANACGKPVVGARSGGSPDAVRDGETGLLVEPNDEMGLAAALLRLLCDGDFAARLGRNGRRWVVAEASWDHVVRHLYTAMADHLQT